MLVFLHVLSVLASGIWLGGLVFTTVVVSPAFRQMTWSPAERIAVRSAVGRQYSKVARLNLLILVLAAAGHHFMIGWSGRAWLEVALILLVTALSELHALFFAPRLAQVARSGDSAARATALRASISVSMLNLLLSLVLAAIIAAPIG